MKVVIHYVRLIKKEGPVQLLYELLKENTNNQLSNIIITCGFKDDAYFQLFKNLNVEIIFINRLNIIKLLYHVIKINKKNGIINFHTYCTTGIIFSALLPFNFIRIHSCLIELGIQAINMNGYFKGKLINFLNLICYKRMDYLVAGSTGVANSLKNFKPNKIVTIFNAVSINTNNVDFFYSEKKYIITVCRLSKEKNIVHLINYFKKLNDPQLCLLIIGDGPEMDILKESVIGIDNISLLGFVSNFEYYLKNAQLYVSSSLTEGLPMAVLSAMSFNLPLLLSNISGHKDCIFENGFLFDLDNFVEFKSSLYNILDNQVHFAQKSKILYSKNFSSEIMFNNFLNIYE